MSKTIKNLWDVYWFYRDVEYFDVGYMIIEADSKEKALEIFRSTTTAQKLFFRYENEYFGEKDEYLYELSIDPLEIYSEK